MRSKKAIINIISSLALQLVALVSGFIIPKLIITKFGSNVNGLVTSITQFLAYITLLESGFGPVVKATLYKPIADNDKKQIENILCSTERFFRVIAGIFVIYLIGLSIVYPFIVNTEFEFIYTMSLVLIISSSIFVEYYFGMTYKLYLQAEQKTYIISIVQIIGYVFNVIAVIVLVKLNCSIHIIKLVSGIIFVLRPIVQKIYVKKKYNINLKNANKEFKLKQKWDGLAQHIAAVVHGNTDITLLTIFTPIEEVSVYSIYYMVIQGVKALVQSLTSGIDSAFGDMLAKNEKDQLNERFKIYEIFYHTINTILFTCTISLIIPFITIYTKNVSDVNYIRPEFALLITIAEFICMTRMPYISLVYAAGHFKQTKKGAWIEAIVNLIVSIVLIKKYGIIGVALGTLVAMIIRTIEFMYYSSKRILDRKITFSFEWIVIIGLETVLLIFIDSLIPNSNITNYKDWIILAVKIGLIHAILVLSINGIMFKKYLKEIFNIINCFFKKR